MGNKPTGRHYTSKGVVGVNKSLSKAVRRDNPVSLAGKFAAYAKGKKAYMTIANPDKKARNKRFIRVNMRELYGDPKEFAYVIQK